MNVFISYAHSDEDKAKRIEADLRQQYVGFWIDKKSITPGTTWLKEIDDGLRQADYVFGIVTRNYIDSTGMLEAYASISDGLSKKKIKFIPLFFENVKEIDSPILKALQGYRFYENYNTVLLDLIRFLKGEEPEHPCELLSKVEGEHSKNPFRRTRAEFFESDYSLAMAFADPEKERYELVRGRTPLFIFGGRGSGKTMILRSLTPEVIVSRQGVKTFQEARDKGIDYFGIYLRLVRGSFTIADNNTILNLGFLNVGISKDYNLYRELWEKLNKGLSDEPIISSGINAARTIFLNELNLKILKAVLIKLKHLQEIGIMDISNTSEQNISFLIAKKINPSMTITTFTDLISILDIEIDKIKDYLQKITLPLCGTIMPNWATTGSDFLDHASKILIDNITALHNTKLYFLLDEFENLFPYQQVIINEWVKTFNNVVVKVGLKYEGMFTNMTLQGQPLQFKVGECDEITLDYDLFSDTDFAQYKKLFKKICATLLSLEGYKETDIENLLDIPSSPELPQETIDGYIKEIAGKRFRGNKIKEFRNKLEIAAIFRLLRKKEKVEGRTSREKVYAGFDTYTYLSSGIIRVFLNLLGMAVYRAEGKGTSVRDGQKISVEDQSWAARIVSKGYLEKIHKNVEAYGGINGEVMYQFVTDIGDIFRERLLFHSSEPETLSISIKDTHHLDREEYRLIKNFLIHGVRESILYKREETSSYRPKQTTGIRTKDYVLNRVYTPALEISHRSRWGRCRFSVKELSDLITANKREAVKKSLQERQGVTEESPLFDKEEATE
jgi:hypothetical protein